MQINFFHFQDLSMKDVINDYHQPKRISFILVSQYANIVIIINNLAYSFLGVVLVELLVLTFVTFATPPILVIIILVMVIIV